MMYKKSFEESPESKKNIIPTIRKGTLSYGDMVYSNQ